MFVMDPAGDSILIFMYGIGREPLVGFWFEVTGVWVEMAGKFGVGEG